MKFSERQERMVGHFLGESSHIVKNLSPTAQTQTLLQVRRRLHTELVHLHCETLKDDDLWDLLERLRVSPTGWQQPPAGSQNDSAAHCNTATPGRARNLETHAFEFVAGPRGGGSVSSSPARPPVEERRLLGVCVTLSDRTAIPLRYLRAAFVVAGLITGPFALIIYLGLYFEMFFAREEAGPSPFAPGQLVTIAGPTLVALTVLYAAATAILSLLDMLFERLVAAPVALGAWQRFADYNASLFLASLLVLVPMAVLSALPVPIQLRPRMRRCLHAGLSTYAVVLCMGVASHLTGFLLGIAQGYNG